MSEDLLISTAIDFSTRAHKNQLRKYTGEPYIVHPFAVAGLVSHVSDIDEEMICSALLHDVVEDTPVEIETIAGILEQELQK